MYKFRATIITKYISLDSERAYFGGNNSGARDDQREYKLETEKFLSKQNAELSTCNVL
jgi:hypothetical protein